MKRLLILAVLLSPLVLMAQGVTPKENKTVVNVFHPLNMHRSDFEKNLAQHNQEFHKGKFAVNIYEVLTGSRRWEYHFVYRSRFSWAGVGSTYEAASEKNHSMDWSGNVAKHLTDESPTYIYETSDDSYISPNPSEMHTELIALYLIDINPGMEDDFFAGIKKIKEMNQKANSKNYYLIQASSFGKGTQVIVVIPLSKGWASFEPDPNEAWDKLFKAAFPKEDFGVWSKKFTNTQKSFESLVAKYRPDLSSPM